MDYHVVNFQQLSHQLKDELCEWLGRNDVKYNGMADNGDVEAMFKPANTPESFETFTLKEA